MDVAKQIQVCIVRADLFILHASQWLKVAVPAVVAASLLIVASLRLKKRWR